MPRLRRDRLSWRELLGLAAAVLAAVALFLPWTLLTASDPAVASALAALPEGDVVRDGWASGIFAWLPTVLLVLAGLAVVPLSRIGAVWRQGLPQLWLIAAVVCCALLLIGWFAMGAQFGQQASALFDDAGVRLGPGTGRYLGSAAALASVVAAAFEVRALRGQLPPRQRKPHRRAAFRNR